MGVSPWASASRVSRGKNGRGGTQKKGGRLVKKTCPLQNKKGSQKHTRPGIWKGFCHTSRYACVAALVTLRPLRVCRRLRPLLELLLPLFRAADLLS